MGARQEALEVLPAEARRTTPSYGSNAGEHMRAPPADAGGHHGGRVSMPVREHLDGKRHKGLLKHSTLIVLSRDPREAISRTNAFVDPIGSPHIPGPTSVGVGAAESDAGRRSTTSWSVRHAHLLSWAREQQYLAHDRMQGIRPARVPKEEQRLAYSPTNSSACRTPPLP